MAGDQRLAALESLFRALSDRTRLRILGLLRAGEVCVCDIHDSLGIPQSKASRHLAYLRRTGLVTGRRSGLWVHYRVADPADPVLAAVLDVIAHAFGHLDAAQRDLVRLSARTGAPELPVAESRSLPCCTAGRSPSRRSARTSRARRRVRSGVRREKQAP
jgi:ArsR family transcriptional regulator, arsenate/arsenite/antimonite-responsive transcriptional repressor